MTLEDTLQNDLKQAMLARDEQTVSVLRMLKSTLLYAKVAKGGRDQVMDDASIQDLLAKEAKKRQESADLFEQGGNPEKAAIERAEKAIIERYLPKQLSEAEVVALIDQVIGELGASDASQMGPVIGRVKQMAGASAEGSLVAKLVKERLSQ